MSARPAPPARDRLDVWTYFEDGEEIPLGNPGVTDAERAAAGLLEAGFRTPTQEWAQRLERAGLPCHHHEWVGGHDHLWWDQQLPAALAWLLAPS
jgi:enterochelin esterase-like enzyme